jgi:hypothetical protein
VRERSGEREERRGEREELYQRWKKQVTLLEEAPMSSTGDERLEAARRVSHVQNRTPPCSGACHA